jgi:hypothetical protein
MSVDAGVADLLAIDALAVEEPGVGGVVGATVLEVVAAEEVIGNAHLL